MQLGCDVRVPTWAVLSRRQCVLFFFYRLAPVPPDRRFRITRCVLSLGSGLPCPFFCFASVPISASGNAQIVFVFVFILSILW